MSIVNLVEWWNQNENVDAKSKIGNLWRTDENAWFSWRENLTLTNRFRKWLFRWLVKKTIWKIWKRFVQLRWCSCWAGKTYQHTTNFTRSINKKNDVDSNFLTSQFDNKMSAFFPKFCSLHYANYDHNGPTSAFGTRRLTMWIPNFQILCTLLVP